MARYEAAVRRFYKSVKFFRRIRLRRTKQLPMKIKTTPETDWEKCALDIVGPLIQFSDGNKYVLTFQDELSKYTLALPIR
jgi:hypothetical protein